MNVMPLPRVVVEDGGGGVVARVAAHRLASVAARRVAADRLTGVTP